MRSGRETKRRRHAAANDAILHAASLRMLAGQGLDLFSFSLLAKEAGLTRAPIYARYDSPEDVAVELWATTLEPELDRVLSLGAAWFSSDLVDPPAELISALSAPSPESNALTEVMAVARRYPSLQDVVQTSLDERLGKYVGDQDRPQAMGVVQVSILLGAVFLAPFLGPRSVDGWIPTMSMARELVNDRETYAMEPVSSDPLEIPIVGPPTGDGLLDEFLPAILRVIARVGYENATANRISREAGRAFNVLYDRFDSKESLMQHVVSEWVASGIRLSFTPFVGATPRQFVDRSVAAGRSIVAPVNRPFRNLRNEMVLAARHHPVIGRDTSSQYLAAALAGHEVIGQLYEGLDDGIIDDIGHIGSIVRSNGFGLSLLASCTPSLADVDWTPASNALQRLIWSRTLGRLRPRHD